MNTIPAIIGGNPIFDSKINIVKPQLPAFEEIQNKVENILSTGMVTKGQHIQEFENAVANSLNVKHAIAVSSCTSGLMLTYQALGLKDDVIVPSFTFMATVSSMVWAGLKPVFADIDRDTTNLDPAAVEKTVTSRTTAIVAVHNFGNPAEIEELQKIADKYDLKLVFDAAHGFGTLYQGMTVGAQGNAQVFSLSPTKLVIAGEGGIVTTNDDELAQKIRWGREYGNCGNYDSAFAGMNARMAEFNAILGLHSLQLLEDAVVNRNKIAQIYQEGLSDIPGIYFQKIKEGNRSSYKDFSIVIDAEKFGLNRDQLAIALQAENIDSRKYYFPAVHQQTAYRDFYNGIPLPNTDWLSQNSLSLPIWSNMNESIANKIVEAIRRIHFNSSEIKEKIKS